MRHILIATTALVLTACGERADTANSETAGGTATGSSSNTSAGTTSTTNDLGLPVVSSDSGTATGGTASQNGMDTMGTQGAATNGRGSGMPGYATTGRTAQSGAMSGGAISGDAMSGGPSSGGAGSGGAMSGGAMSGGSTSGSPRQGGAMQNDGSQGAAGKAANQGTARNAALTGNSPQAYVANAAMSDMYERESSQLAVKTAKSDKVKAFARQMIADHTATTAEVKTILSDGSLGVTPPAQLDRRRQSLLDSLRKVAATDFDQVYLQQQTAAHREALALHRGFADAGANAALKAFAARTAPKVKMHLDMVEKLGTAS